MRRNAGAPAGALRTRPGLWLAAAAVLAPLGTILHDLGLFHGLAVFAALTALWLAVARP